MMVDLDTRGDFQHQRPETEGNSVEIQVGNKPGQVVKVGKNLPTNIMKNITNVLHDNKDIFAWVAFDMSEVDPEFCRHRLTIREGSKPISQKKRRMSPRKNNDH